MKHATEYALCSIALLLSSVFPVTSFAQAAKLPNAIAAAQAVTQAVPPPPPAQIASARTVFLTKGGDDPNFPIDPTQSYNDIYAALKAWGHYQLVSAPDQADLVFQLRGVAPIAGFGGADGTVSSYTSPAFQLIIRDPKSNVALWTITSPVTLAGRGRTFARWVSTSETNLVSRIKVLAGQPLSAVETNNLTTFPKYHTLRTELILTGAIVGAGVGGGFLIHHLYENGLANQKAQQDAFCSANHIPPSECAGG
jgi:hypothetical protein